MKVRAKIIIPAVVVVLALAGLIWKSSRSAGRELERYKAELRAGGEKLNWSELGFPRQPEASEFADRFIAVATKIGYRGNPNPMQLVAAGKAQVAWATPHPPWLDGTNQTWETLDRALTADDLVSELRSAVERPPHFWQPNPTNWSGSAAPFVAMRNAAQALAIDAISALHFGDLGRARGDLHALTQLARFYSEDQRLVTQMIRVAILRLALAITWEALQAEGWTDPDLCTFQREFDSFEPFADLEKALEGERAAGCYHISVLRTNSGALQPSSPFISGGPPVPVRKTWHDYLQEWIVLPLWRANSKADELFFLEQCQALLEASRNVRAGKPWPEIAAGLNASGAALQAKAKDPLFRIRHLASFPVTPNFTKALHTVTWCETQRRLTLVAIALERFRLRHGRLPPDLNALAPEFLAAVPMDLMNAKPLGYRLDPDEKPVLYSVGEDGRDDGGNPSPPAGTKGLGLRSGKDAVWPER